MRGNVGKKSPGKEASCADAWIFRCLFSTCPQRKTHFQMRMEYFTLELVLGLRAYYQRRSSVTSDWAMACPATHVAKLSYILTMQ